MDLIKDATDFYKDGYLISILNITYNYINYFLCLIYLYWYSYNITINIAINNKLYNFANENYINYYLIFYSFYKINSFVKKNKNIIFDIILSIIYIGVFCLDFNNNNTIHNIQFWIFYNLLINTFIFIYGTLYLIIKSDFNNHDDIHDNYIDFTA